MRPDDTHVVVSVTERSERDLTKRFDETEIQWSVAEQKLVAWGQYFQKGKKLRVYLSFNYVGAGPQLTASLVKRADKRGPVSTTQCMLAERELQLAAEEESSGQPSIWRGVYNLMRCPGPPCHLGPHCWIDPVRKKHYKLSTHHLRELIRYVEQHGDLQTYDDVPLNLRNERFPVSFNERP